MPIAAVVVTYDPPAGFLDSMGIWMSQVDYLLVVDNGSSVEWRESVCSTVQEKYTNVEFLFNEKNLGIAAALNRAFGRLIDSGLEFAVVLDQDSRPAPGMISEMLRVHSTDPARSQVAIVAPNINIPSANNSFRFLQPRGTFLYRRVRCTDQDTLDNVTAVITSGALYNLNTYRRIGPFREDFFIDYVDTEYCLRAQQHGFKIVVACRAHLQHQFGHQRERRFGPLIMHPSFHSPLRWYYISRNRVPVTRMYAWLFPHWLLHELAVNFNGLVRLVLFEDHKLSKALAVLLGTWDGLMNHLGPVSDGRRSCLVRY